MHAVRSGRVHIQQRLERIKQSIGRINQLMTELKGMKEEKK